MLSESLLKEINRCARTAFKYHHFNIVEEHDDGFAFFVTRQFAWSKPMGVRLEIFERNIRFHELRNICLSMPPHTYLCYVQVFQDGSFKTNFISRNSFFKHISD